MQRIKPAESHDGKRKDSDDQFLWSNNLAAGQPPTLAGFPVFEFQGMPDIAANANAVAFANLSAAYTIVDRMGIRTLRDPFTAKPTSYSTGPSGLAAI